MADSWLSGGFCWASLVRGDGCGGRSRAVVSICEKRRFGDGVGGVRRESESCSLIDGLSLLLEFPECSVMCLLTVKGQ